MIAVGLGRGRSDDAIDTDGCRAASSTSAGVDACSGHGLHIRQDRQQANHFPEVSRSGQRLHPGASGLCCCYCCSPPTHTLLTLLLACCCCCCSPPPHTHLTLPLRVPARWTTGAAGNPCSLHWRPPSCVTGTLASGVMGYVGWLGVCSLAHTLPPPPLSRMLTLLHHCSCPAGDFRPAAHRQHGPDHAHLQL